MSTFGWTGKILRVDLSKGTFEDARTVTLLLRDFRNGDRAHISRLMVESIAELLAHAEVIVVGNSSAEFMDLLPQTRPEQVVIDLVRIGNRRSEEGRYEGICW